MCGRYVAARATADWVPLFDIEYTPDDLPEPSYNIAPSEQIRIVAESAATGRRLASARWGFVAPFKKAPNDGPTPFNARSETIGSNRMFSPSFAKRRALIPASGFYERRRTGERQGFYVHPDNDETLTFAGLYAWWQNREVPEDHEARWVLSATIITRAAQGEMTDIHDREPLYLAPEFWDEWLDPETTDAGGLLEAALGSSADIAQGLDFRPIGPGWQKTMRGSKLDDPALLAAIAG